MKSLMITYDLNRPGQNYGRLHKAIEELGNWWHCLDSNWIVKTSLSAVEARDRLLPYIDANDALLVVSLSGEAAWQGFTDECSSWLKNNL